MKTHNQAGTTSLEGNTMSKEKTKNTEAATMPQEASEEQGQGGTAAPEKTPEPQTEVKTVPIEELNAILRHHVWGAMGVGLIPVPVVDVIALTGVQINMLRRLAEVYEIPFMKDTVKNILSALIGSALPVAVAPGVASLVKAIPIIGQTAGAVTMSLTGGAATYAVGKVFIQHFASGGTFLSFDPEKFKAYYTEMFEEGKKFVTKMKHEKSQKPEQSDKA
jgi:uncharacterized protein (DUF697 family)